MPRHAVLDGISSAYPPVAGRLHTCYSPVRRSPAGDGKPSPPLPLDLHVLSLSLAFILSQDQTLRCCILFLFSFQNQKKARRVYVVYTFADTHAAPTRNESSSPAVIESPGRTDRDISAAGTDPDGAFSCTTSSLIYCNSFNVLSFRFFSETLCKVNTFFRHGQILMRFLTNFFVSTALQPSKSRIRRPFLRKASAKLQPFHQTTKSFMHFFEKISRKNNTQ